MDENVHRGHRQRQKAKFLDHGLDSFTDIEAIELLLFFALPRRDTNVLAHALLDRFRNLRGVLTADLDALRSVPGVGENAALLIRLVTALNRRCAEAKHAEKPVVITNARSAGAYLLPYFQYRREECLMLLCLDAASRVIQCHRVAEGGPDALRFDPRPLVSLVLQDRASRVILAHNHPSDCAVPSKVDVEATQTLQQLLRVLNVELADHLVFADDDWVSMSESKQLPRY